jgi:predicted house-cleaning noncanonical NTP pyrophosphatase (MazG superfamily)
MATKKQIKKYNKLVRDKLPKIIKEENRDYSIRKLDDSEMLNALCQKLKEEAQEFCENPCIEELVDVRTVIDAIQAHMQISNFNFVYKIREKLDHCGGFKKGYFLEWAET